MIKSLLNAEELEEAICGQKKLDLTELRYTAKYCQDFTPECDMMKWFWDIVLEEWDDEKRRKLLEFATGSDRVPINGFKSMDFYIIQESPDDKRIPSSHTCFN